MEIHKLNLEKLPLELKLLISIHRNQGQSTYTKIYEEQVDWSIFLELVIHHRLFPGLVRKIEKNKYIKRIIPDSILLELNQWDKMNTFQMLRLTGEMQKLSRLFRDQDINILFLKGPILAKALYGDISLRTSSDLDLLISLSDLKRTEESLIELGYIKDDYISTILNDWKWRHHHLTFFNPEKKVKVEVHWRLNPGPGKEPSFKSLWERKQVISFSGVKLNCLGNEDLFYFLVTHGSRHGWSRLRWLVDIHQLMTKSLKWEKISLLFRQFKHLPLMGQAVILSNDLFDTQIEESEKFIKRAKNRSWLLANEAIFYLEQMVNLHDEPLGNDISSYHKRHLTHLMPIKQRSLFYLSFLFPYPEDAEHFPLPKALHFLYVPLRPFIWTWRVCRRRKLQIQDVKK